MVVVLAGACASVAPAAAGAQPAYVTFDDWYLPCAAADSCTGGYLEGPASAFTLVGGSDGFVCAEGRCLDVAWPSPGTGLVARAAPYTTPEEGVVVQAQFFFPLDLFRRLAADRTLQVPLLHIETSSDEYYMRLILVGGSPPSLQGAVWAGTATAPDRMEIAGTIVADEWTTIRWGVALRTRPGESHAIATVRLMETLMPIVGPIPEDVILVGARALGTVPAVPTGAPLRLAIDNLCVAPGELEANNMCPIGEAIPPVDDGGVPGPDSSVPTDASPTVDSGVEVDSGGAIDSGEAVDSGRDRTDADSNVASFRGAGGCTCDIGAGPPPGAPWAWLAVAIVLLGWRRR